VNLGSVEVFIITNAPNVCNHVFADCNGSCTACYINKDSLQSCIDSTGRQYIRQ
jgi:Fe-S cluster biogenesis protein NfuA